jgi:hypothetical protein
VIHVFTLSGGAAHDPGVVSFQWSGSRYLVRGKSIGFSDFTAHPYEGRDWILQGMTQRAPIRVEYGLARRFADGVYLLVPINEDDADEAARQRFCTKTQDTSCQVATPEQLFVLARASADKQTEGGGLAVVVPSGNANSASGDISSPGPEKRSHGERTGPAGVSAPARSRRIR